MTFGVVPSFQTVFPAVRFQFPLPEVTAAPSSDVVSHVKFAAQTGVTNQVKNEDAAKALSSDVNLGFIVEWF